jgi:hypothetical protein
MNCPADNAAARFMHNNAEGDETVFDGILDFV